MDPDTTPSASNWPELVRKRRAIVVVDVVESVRLMRLDEVAVIDRWRRFVNEVRTQVLPARGGRMVKSLGDGMLVEFAAVHDAAGAALEMNARMAASNISRDAASAMYLRIGIHVADVLVDDVDVYGVGVNLAARVATLAGPGEVVVTADARDQLVVGLDVDVEDMGDCYLKHIEDPVRAYRVGPAQAPPTLLPASGADTLLAGIAVVPFTCADDDDPARDPIGELLAESVIASLSRSKALRVISRLSTAALRSRARKPHEIKALLGATFVVSGSYRVSGGRVFLRVDLVDLRNDNSMWVKELNASLGDLVQPDCSTASLICEAIVDAISSKELVRVRSAPLPTLEGFSLQLAAIALMHRSSRHDFQRSREILEYLAERYPRAAEPRAWLAKWYVLRVTGAFVEISAGEAGRALDNTGRALHALPDCTLALAVEGFVYCHMLRDLDTADERLDLALALNPNESLAWLYKCVTQGFRGAGHEAVACAERAIRLSPLDPMRHYYLGLAASAALAVGYLDRTIELARHALSVNRNHLPTLRALTIAQVENGDVVQARATAQRVMALEPRLTVRDYIARGPKGSEGTRVRYGAALAHAGVPQ